jgi:hypothetical protein
MHLEQLEAGDGWLAEGPGGVSIGSIVDALHGSAAVDTDPDWISAVIAAVARELVVGVRRSMLLVTRASGVRFHATRTSGRSTSRTSGWRERQMPAAATTTG